MGFLHPSYTPSCPLPLCRHDPRLPSPLYLWCFYCWPLPPRPLTSPLFIRFLIFYLSQPTYFRSSLTKTADRPFFSKCFDRTRWALLCACEIPLSKDLYPCLYHVCFSFHEFGFIRPDPIWTLHLASHARCEVPSLRRPCRADHMCCLHARL